MFSRKHLSSYILNVGMIDLYIQLFCTIVPSTPLENLLYLYIHLFFVPTLLSALNAHCMYCYE